MFDVAPTELIVVAVVALLVIGPKDLPRALHQLGKWVGKVKGMARHFRTGLDTMIREAELAEMEKKWAEDNARIMRATAAEGTEPVVTTPPSEPTAPPAASPSAPNPPAAGEPTL